MSVSEVGIWRQAARAMSTAALSCNPGVETSSEASEALSIACIRFILCFARNISVNHI